eukprot:TRINITY_DN6079_c0_g1_i1.p1 TRINITY_DN6079_c0_g1~~TRINITY_DN6079_c0_g1_i1.p1  ORF type:complete len:755 (-),score=162.45 TRINITY_DN6079_c0_g1_i1:45-2309(-)
MEQGADQTSLQARDPWREKLPTEERTKMVNMILNTIREHIVKSPNNAANSDENALKDLAMKFEEVVFNQSPTKDRYYSLIAQKIINLRNKTPNPASPNPAQPAIAGPNAHIAPPTQPPNQAQTITPPPNNSMPTNPSIVSTNSNPLNSNPIVVPTNPNVSPNPNMMPSNPNMLAPNPNMVPTMYPPNTNNPNMAPYTISTGMAVPPTIPTVPTIPNPNPNPNPPPNLNIKADPSAPVPQVKNTWEKWKSLQHYAQNLSNMSQQIDGYIKGQNNGDRNNAKIQQYQLIVQRINSYRHVLMMPQEQFKESKITYDYLETMEKQITVWMNNYQKSSAQHGLAKASVPLPGSAPPGPLPNGSAIPVTTSTIITPSITTTTTTTATIPTIPVQTTQPLTSNQAPTATPPVASQINLDESAQSNLVRIISEHISNDGEIKLKTSFSAEIASLSRLNKGSNTPLVISILQNINSSNTTPSTPVFTPVSTPSINIGSPQITDSSNDINNNNTVSINVSTTLNISNTNPVQRSPMWWNPNASAQSTTTSPPASPVQINCKEKQKAEKPDLSDSAPDKKRSKTESLTPAGGSMSQFGSANKSNETESFGGNQGEKLSDVDGTLCFGCKIPLPGPFEGVGMCCSCTLKKIEKSYESKLLEELNKVHEAGWKIFSRFTPTQYTTYIYSPSTLFPLVVIFSTPNNPNLSIPLYAPRFSFYYYKLSSDVSSLQRLREQFELSVEKQKAYSSIVSVSNIWSSVLQSHSK